MNPTSVGLDNLLGHDGNRHVFLLILSKMDIVLLEERTRDGDGGVLGDPR